MPIFLRQTESEEYGLTVQYAQEGLKSKPLCEEEEVPSLLTPRSVSLALLSEMYKEQSICIITGRYP